MAKKNKAENKPETVLIPAQEVPQTVAPYNPLDHSNLAKSVADALLASPVHPLPPGKALPGAGIYAIYYTGNFAQYRPVAEANRDDKFQMPIYIGKAIPKGSRKGKDKDGASNVSLFERIGQHADSVRAASNLEPEHFFCRFLVVDALWIPLGERMLIRRFRPVWNQVVDGFGNKDPGAKRYNQEKSAWDMIHPGRPWEPKMKVPNRKTAAQILKAIEDFYKAEGK